MDNQLDLSTAINGSKWRLRGGGVFVFGAFNADAIDPCQVSGWCSGAAISLYRNGQHFSDESFDVVGPAGGER